MTKYVVIANRPNRISTVHTSACSYIGLDVLAQSVSAERRGFDDGFEATVFAQNAMPHNFGLCGHCLKDLRRMITANKSAN